MDGKRFDNFARRLSRRKAIGGLGATGLVAAASRVLPAAAQDGVTCQMSVQALTSVGPSVDMAYAGVLEITLAGDGSIDTGSLAFTGGPTVPSWGKPMGARSRCAPPFRMAMRWCSPVPAKTISNAVPGRFLASLAVPSWAIPAPG